MTGVLMKHDKHTYGIEWSTSRDGGSYARKTEVSTNYFDVGIAPGNHDNFLGDPKQPTPKFYGGGYPVSNSAAPESCNVNRLLRGSTDGGPLPTTHVARFALLFMSRQERDSFIGDLEERHGILLHKMGRRAATRWFWQEVIHSFLSLALDALKKVSGVEKLMRRIGS